MSLSSPGLIKAANDALVAVSPDINIASLFATDFSDAAAEYGDYVKVPIAAAAASNVLLYPGQGETLNDYETDSGSITYGTVQLNKQPKATLKVPAIGEFAAPNSPYWKKVSRACIEAVDVGISTGLGGLFTTSACAGGKVVLASVTKASVAGLISSCAGRVASTVLALNPANYATLLSLLDSSAFGGAEAIRTGYIPQLYGFKAVVCMRDLPSGVTGALIPDTAVAVAARGTVKDFSPFIEGDNVTDENGFTLTVTRHFSGAKREQFVNCDVLWGASIVQGTKVKYLAAS